MRITSATPGAEDFGPGQLARWLGLQEWQVRRARERGLIPPPDVAGARWSRTLAVTILDDVDRVRAELGGRYTSPSVPRSAPDREPAPTDAPASAAASRGRRDTLGPIQLARLLGLKEWQVRRAQERGLIPPPDVEDARWSQAAVARLPVLVGQILAVVGTHPGLGTEKAAAHLADRTGLPVERSDVQDLADDGDLQPVGDYRGWPLYAVEALDAVPARRIADVVRARQDWITASLTASEAAEALGVSLGRFEVTVESAGVTAGRFDRYARTDVDRLRPPTG